MENDIQVKTKVYEKRNSYQSLYICQGLTSSEEQTKRALNILGQGIAHLPLEWKYILNQVILDLKNPLSNQETFVITTFVQMKCVFYQILIFLDIFIIVIDTRYFH